MFFQKEDTFICVDNLLQIRLMSGDINKRMGGVILLKQNDRLLFLELTLEMQGGKNASRKISPEWKKINVMIKIRLELPQTLGDFSKMLVGECFIHRNVVAAPAEMGGRARVVACSRGAGDRTDLHFAADQFFLGQRK